MESDRPAADRAASPPGWPSKQAAPRRPTDSVCVEIPVRIQGAPAGPRTQDGAERVEPFDEETRTLILFPKGAVVRLASRVKPGQEVLLTNLRTKRLVHSRVLTVRDCAFAKSYVEIEFTHSVTGFWGITFPGEPPRAPILGLSSPTIAEPAKKQAAAQSPRMQAQVEPVREEARIQPVSSGAAEIQALAREVPLVTPERPAAPGAPIDLPSSPAVRETPVATLPIFPPTAVFQGPRFDVQSRAQRTGRRRQPRRKLVLASCLAATALIFAANEIGFRPWLTNRADSRVTSGPVTGNLANLNVAPSGSAPLLGLKTSPGAPAPQLPPGFNSTGQFVVTDDASSPSSSGASTETSKSVDAKVPGGADTGPSAPPKKLELGASKPAVYIPAPTKVAAPEEEPPVFVGDSSTGIPGTQANGVISAISSDPTRLSAPAPPPVPAPPPPARAAGDTRPPRVVSTVMPVYPAVAKQYKLEGDVTVQADIDAAGNVVRVKAISGHHLLLEAAMEAVGKWKYEAARLDGRPVSGQVQVTLKFHLR